MPRLNQATVAHRHAAGQPKRTRAPRKGARRADKGKRHSYRRRYCACGRLASAGWSTRGPHDRCITCEIAPPRLVLRPGKQSTPPAGICACCGRAGRIVALGLRSACYQARRKYGLLDEWRRYYQEARQ